MATLWCLAQLPGCGPPPKLEKVPTEEERAHQAFLDSLPEDTVFLVEDRPITRSEINRWLETYRMMEPAATDHALRRFILTNYNLPVAIGQVMDPEGRLEAQHRLEQVRAKIESGRPLSLEDPQIQRLEDTWKSEIGLDRWGIAKDTPMGEWSEPFETLGGFTMVRPIGAPDPLLPNSVIEIEHVTVPYLPQDAVKEIINTGYEQVQIQIIDPEWERYMPVINLYNNKLPKSQ